MPHVIRCWSVEHVIAIRNNNNKAICTCNCSWYISFTSHGLFRSMDKNWLIFTKIQEWRAISHVTVFRGKCLRNITKYNFNHWGHINVSINRTSFCRCQAIIWTNAGLFDHWEWIAEKFESNTAIFIRENWSKVSPAEWWSFSLGLSVLRI